MREEAVARRAGLAAAPPQPPGEGADDDPDEPLGDLWLLNGQPLSSRCAAAPAPPSPLCSPPTERKSAAGI